MIYLNDIATIYMGYTYRGSLKDTGCGNVKVIQMKDAWPGCIDKTEAFPMINLKKIPRHFPLRKGDLIFRSRGLRNITVLIENVMGCTICNSPLMFIRVDQGQPVLPAYLNWYLNLPQTQAILDAYATGEKVRMISQIAMKALPVPVPALTVQQTIVDEARKERQFLIEHEEKVTKLKTKTTNALLKFAMNNSA